MRNPFSETHTLEPQHAEMSARQLQSLLAEESQTSLTVFATTKVVRTYPRESSLSS